MTDTRKPLTPTFSDYWNYVKMIASIADTPDELREFCRDQVMIDNNTIMAHTTAHPSYTADSAFFYDAQIVWKENHA